MEPFSGSFRNPLNALNTWGKVALSLILLSLGLSLGAFLLAGKSLSLLLSFLSTFLLVIFLVATLMVVPSFSRVIRRWITYDMLTGIYNRNRLNDDLEHYHRLFLRYQREYSILVIDLDHFKRVNDRYGHRVGDEVLKELAQVLRSMLRESDLLYRYGGEEFVILALDTGYEEAQSLAERVREAIAEQIFLKDSLSLRLTASVGFATAISGESPRDPWALLQIADLAMYRAKALGRNRVAGEGELVNV